jgi:hypothetical protein
MAVRFFQILKFVDEPKLHIYWMEFRMEFRGHHT